MSLQSITDSIVKLLPSGSVWQNYPGSNLWTTVNLFSPALQRLQQFSDTNQIERFPTTVSQIGLPDWQQSCMLPDMQYSAWASLSPSQQKSQMLLRVQDLGGASIAYFTQFAAKLGYTITISEYSQPRAQTARVGCRLFGAGGDSIWHIQVQGLENIPFRVGNRAGSPLNIVSSDITLLVYELTRNSPGHTVIFWD